LRPKCIEQWQGTGIGVRGQKEDQKAKIKAKILPLKVLDFSFWFLTLDFDLGEENG